MNMTRVIVLVIAIIVVSLGGGGAWYMKRNAADEAAKIAAIAEKPVVVVVVVETPIESLLKRAQADDVAAQVRLAQLYLAPQPTAGFDLPKSQSLAFSWYKRAADNGDAEAQFRLAEMYLAARRSNRYDQGNESISQSRRAKPYRRCRAAWLDVLADLKRPAP